jgi:diacylglycerol kinase (ATP)
MRRVFLFYNPVLVASRSRLELLSRIASLFRAQHARHGGEVKVAPTLSAFSAGAQAADAVAAGFDTFLVCGGDGTVFQVLQGIAGTGAALGVIPMGTGNVIAQNLGLPRNPLRAAQMLVDAVPREIALGRTVLHPVGHGSLRSWHFIIAAGMGMHAALMNLAPTGDGKRLGGRSAYFAGGLRLLLKDSVEAFSLEITGPSGQTRQVVASEAIAVNLPEINLWRPGGDWSKPALRLAWVPQTNRAGLFAGIVRALSNRMPGSNSAAGPYYEDVTRIVCRPLPDRSDRLLVEADGEVLGRAYVEISIAPERLRLLGPKTLKP